MHAATRAGALDPAGREVLLRWSCEHALLQIQGALRGILDNLPNRPAAWLLRPVVFPLGARFRGPSDRLGSEVARELLDGRPGRLRLSLDVYVPPESELGLGRLEAALEKVVRAQAVSRKIRQAVRAGKLERRPSDTLAERALAAGVVSDQEREALAEAIEARDDVIQVDAFTPDEFPTLTPRSQRAAAEPEAAAAR